MNLKIPAGNSENLFFLFCKNSKLHKLLSPFLLVVLRAMMQATITCVPPACDDDDMHHCM